MIKMRMNKINIKNKKVKKMKINLKMKKFKKKVRQINFNHKLKLIN